MIEVLNDRSYLNLENKGKQKRNLLFLGIEELQAF